LAARFVVKDGNGQVARIADAPGANVNPGARYRIVFGPLIVVLGLSIICFMKATVASGVG